MRPFAWSRIGSAAFVCVTAAVFAIWLVGWPIVDPSNLKWMRGDLVTMQFAWQAYRADPSPAWTLSTTLVSWPLPIRIAMFDIVPVIALPLKLISFLLPETFQYFGLMFVANVALQGLFACLFLEEALPDRQESAELRAALILGALFFATAPVLFVRFWLGHPPLTAQWLIIAALWLYARCGRVSLARTWIAFALLLGVAGGVNPYLLVMATGVYAASLARLAAEGRLDWRSGAPALAPLLTAFASMVAFGFLDLRGPGVIPGVGYGYFSSNLNALVNPMEGLLGSSLLPPLPLWVSAQYEGYGYLGAGAIALIAASFAVARARRRLYDTFTSPLLAVAAGGLLLAASYTITFGSGFAIRLPLPSAVVSILGIFRSSGRFIWIPAYMLLGVAGFGLLRNVSARTSLAILSLAALLQIADLARPFADLRRQFAGLASIAFDDPIYAGLGQAHRRLIVLPPWQCRMNSDYAIDQFEPISLLAIDNGLATNSFYSGRLPRDQARYHCFDFPKAFRDARPDRETAYLFTPQAFSASGANVRGTHFCDFGDRIHPLPRRSRQGRTVRKSIGRDRADGGRRSRIPGRALTCARRPRSGAAVKREFRRCVAAGWRRENPEPAQQKQRERIGREGGEL